VAGSLLLLLPLVQHPISQNAPQRENPSITRSITPAIRHMLLHLQASLCSGLSITAFSLLGGPPPHPQTTAPGTVHHYCVVDYMVYFGQVPRTCWWVIGLPGGSSPRPPFSRFARRAVVGGTPSSSSFCGDLEHTKVECTRAMLVRPGEKAHKKA
jgi:hypothetical protein